MQCLQKIELLQAYETIHVISVLLRELSMKETGVSQSHKSTLQAEGVTSKFARPSTPLLLLTYCQQTL